METKEKTYTSFTPKKDLQHLDTEIKLINWESMMGGVASRPLMPFKKPSPRFYSNTQNQDHGNTDVIN